MILEKIHTPADVQQLDDCQTEILCDEIRSFLIDSVSKTGGHLASNLGIVELTVAIHKVFDTSKDRLVFDVGHQCYVHKMLTGRKEMFSTLRQFHGLSGFPKPYESEHDAFIAGHASNSVSVALGMARARTLQKKDHCVIALIGDGALGGGMSLEGLNDAGASGEPLIVILNDNGMSIRPNVGGISRSLAKLRSSQNYYEFKKVYRQVLAKNKPGKAVYHAGHNLKSVLKKTILPGSTLFEEMGFTYLGPVDGHDVKMMTAMLEAAKDLHCPVIIHAITKKGLGFEPAEKQPNVFHGVGPYDPGTGLVKGGDKDNFSSVFGEELTKLAKEDARICAITAGMLDGTGLLDFHKAYPERLFDVGIAEEHAVSMAAGLAKSAMIPVFAVYSSFLQRGYDMLMHDVALSGAHVVLCVDRAGLVGADGETHHGCMDVAYLRQVPGMTVFSPSNYAELRSMLNKALYEVSGPVAIRYPRGSEGAFTEDRSGEVVSIINEGSDVTVMTYGTMVNEALIAAERLKTSGISAEVIKLNCLSSLNEYLPPVLENIHTKCLLVLEECNETGGVGQEIGTMLARVERSDILFMLKNLGNKPVPQGSVSQLYEELGINGRAVAAAIEEVYHGK